MAACTWVRSRVSSASTALFCEGPRDGVDRAEGDVADTPLDPADVSPIEPCPPREGFLSNAELLPEQTDARADPSPRLFCHNPDRGHENGASRKACKKCGQRLALAEPEPAGEG